MTDEPTWTFRLVPEDEVSPPIAPEHAAYEKRSQANRRAHCQHCGRFIRADSLYRRWGGYDDTWYWHCSGCGPTHD
jgi:Pyruvate/2-oxoacid:ferredoxin oxidoreductase delta subunit